MARIHQTVDVASVTLSPLARVIRTVLQTVFSFGASLPTLIVLLHLTGVHAAQFSAVVGGIVFVASALQNVLEHLGVIPTIGAKAPTVTIVPPKPPTPPVAAAPVAPKPA